ncbi:GT2 family glycosyltransferase [Flavobacterium sp. CG_23.5]|uniref:glycosyltransferase family 2 protein n=1 Tax=Flavobacterium sp. CG_23.5 TaxID=2760708 RepID=UPI001AEACC05|nr:glycosyltransferase family 2 protein [Flavobacterium sp. CG_23.5]MBP2283631.1 GT2 family glycosyltransferase [Flavobacterium sp. CG_23.5]
MLPELSVVIVNFNGLRYLKGCFDSLVQNLDGIAYEIIVIDNNSHDESCSFIKKNYPEIVVIESKINLGFGKANNEAVKIASGKYLLLLNNDTIILERLMPVLDFLKTDQTIGAIGIKMLDGKRNYLPSAGNFPNYRNMFQMKKLLDRGNEFIKGNFTERFYEVDWLSGSFLLLLTKVFNEIGGFDEDYFLYVEDVDFSKKLANNGYKRVFLPHFSYIHFIGFTKSKNHLLVKGYETYISKHFFGLEKTGIRIVLKLNKWVKNIKSILIKD